MQGSNAELLEKVRATQRDIITAPTIFTTHVNTFLSLAEQLETSLKEGDEQEFEYFNIPLPFATVVPTTAPAPAPDPPILPVPPQTPLFMSRGSLNGDIVNEMKYGDQIKEWLPNRRFELLYKATVDGFSASDFHKHCDHKGATLTIICSDHNHLFGGYTPLPWDSSDVTKSHQDMFIFTLSNPHNLPPTKYSLKSNPDLGICCHSTMGPAFGGGYDIVIYSDSHRTLLSHANFPHDYIDTTKKRNHTFTGAKVFMTNEIEVYSVL